jgi:hypothetical protein
MDTILATEGLEEFATCYIDDILIFSDIAEETSISSLPGLNSFIQEQLDDVPFQIHFWCANHGSLGIPGQQGWDYPHGSKDRSHKGHEVTHRSATPRVTAWIPELLSAIRGQLLGQSSPSHRKCARI